MRRPTPRARPRRSPPPDRVELTIGEVAKATGVNIETVRYYERAGVLPCASRTKGGFRLYSSRDVERLSFVRRARELGFSLDQVRELLGLADDPDRPCDEIDAIARAHLVEVEAKLAQLGGLRSELDRLLAQCRGGHVSDCRIVEALSAGHRRERG